MKKILVAEDDRTTRVLLCRMIEKMGLNPVQAENGREALEVLAGHRETVMVITDVMMPEMDGRQLVRELRANLMYRQIPVIMTSAAVTEVGLREHLEDRITWFMPKPFHKDTLVALMAQAFESFDA